MSGTRTPASSSRSRLRVVTFNAQHAWVERGRPDVGALVAGLAALEPDVVALQEVDRSARDGTVVDQPGAVADALGGRAVFAPLAPRGGTGLAIVARGAIDHVVVTRFVSRRSHAPGWRRRVPLLHPDRRAALWARVTVDGRALTVVTAHLHLVRSVSHLQLERIAALAADRPEPRVLLGDLNRWADWVRPTLAAAGLDLVADPTPTHPVRDPIRRIDHVATSGVTVRSTGVVPVGVGDHLAVVADLDGPDLAAGPSPGDG